MPEGHLIHHYARRHDAGLAGGRVAASSPQGRFPEARELDGRVVESVDPYGKHLFYVFSGDVVVQVHLGMQGRFVEHEAPAPDARPSVRLRLAAARLVVDLVAPMTCKLLDRRGRDLAVAQLGPDPLRTDADPEQVWRLVHGSDTAVGALLLDQSVIAGVGNVLRAEVLNLVRVHPETPGGDLSRDAFDRLWSTLRLVMERAAQDGHVITADPPPGVDRSELDPAEGRYVYKQQVCRRCATPVQRWTLAGRDAYACPTCQPPPG